MRGVCLVLFVTCMVFVSGGLGQVAVNFMLSD